MRSLPNVFFKLDRHQIMALGIILLAWLHVLIYALVMPPWGLLDESQHFHYIQVISEEHPLPVMWQDPLSPAVLDSIFAVKRYVTLGAPAMPSQADLIRSGHFDVESYEAYHPPLYYLLLAPIYSLGPADVLEKLFLL